MMRHAPTEAGTSLPKGPPPNRRRHSAEIFHHQELSAATRQDTCLCLGLEFLRRVHQRSLPLGEIPGGAWRELQKTEPRQPAQAQPTSTSAGSAGSEKFVRYAALKRTTLAMETWPLPAERSHAMKNLLRDL